MLFRTVVLVTLITTGFYLGASETKWLEKRHERIIDIYESNIRAESEANESFLKEIRSKPNFLEWPDFLVILMKNCESTVKAGSTHSRVITITYKSNKHYISLEPKLNHFYGSLKACMGKDFENVELRVE